MIKAKLISYLRWIEKQAEEEHEEMQGISPAKALKAKERQRFVENLSSMVLAGDFD